MKKQAGLWIDHREAIIVLITDGVEEIMHLGSNSGKHVRYSGSSHSTTPAGMKEVTAEDQRDRKFENTLNSFYDEVIATVREAETIQIFGPGEAKGELEKRFAHAGLKDHVVSVETTDKMTDNQISVKVHEYIQHLKHPIT